MSMQGTGARAGPVIGSRSALAFVLAQGADPHTVATLAFVPI
jgi:hypothetical protein